MKTGPFLSRISEAAGLSRDLVEVLALDRFNAGRTSISKTAGAYCRTLRFRSRSKIRPLPWPQLLQKLKTSPVDSVSLPGPGADLGDVGDPGYYYALGSLVQALKPATIFEFGTYLGMGALTLAANGPSDCRVYTLDLPDTAEAGAVPELNVTDQTHVAKSRFRVGEAFLKSPLKSRITQLRDDSMTFRAEKCVTNVDLVFVDGGHSLPVIEKDTENAFRILSPGGSILWDDYFHHYSDVVTFLDDLAERHPLYAIPDTNLGVVQPPVGSADTERPGEMRIVITGSRSGIGQFLARQCCDAGHEVWGLSRGSQISFQRECEARGVLFRSSQCDVSDWSQVAAVREQVGRVWPELDALVCCAGTQEPIGPSMSIEPQAWSRNVRVNLDGTFFSVRVFHDLLARASRRAKVICFSGGGSTNARPHFSAYGCAKAGVVRLVETLAAEWENRPIDINAVAPGAIYSEMTEQVLASGPVVAGEKEYAQAQQLKASGNAPLQNVAGLVEFLLSAASDHITGRLISARWDPWPTLKERRDELMASDIYCLRRIVPGDRGKEWR